MSSVNLQERPGPVDTFIVLFKSKDNKTFLHQKIIYILLRVGYKNF